MFSLVPFGMDLRRRQLSLVGVTVRLGSRVLEILCTLASAKGQLVSKDELMAQVWRGVIVEENAIEVHVSALRKALGETEDCSSYVITVPGRGYRLMAGSTSSYAAAEHPIADKPSIPVLALPN